MLRFSVRVLAQTATLTVTAHNHTFTCFLFFTVLVFFFCGTVGRGTRLPPPDYDADVSMLDYRERIAESKFWHAGSQQFKFVNYSSLQLLYFLLYAYSFSVSWSVLAHDYHHPRGVDVLLTGLL